MSKQTISQTLAQFATGLAWEQIPAPVQERAKLLLIDAVGVAFASTQFDFAQRALAALKHLGAGDSPVIGMAETLSLRDAAMLNGMLIHGLDYDDTYLPGSVHLTASCVPTVLAVAAASGASGEELLVALTLGLETAARLGSAGRGGFLRAGFHATSVCGTFGATMAAGRLMKLDAAQFTLAQGAALSMASGTMQPMQDGSWTKRMHPGWAAVSGITAATLAREGYIGPARAVRRTLRSFYDVPRRAREGRRRRRASCEGARRRVGISARIGEAVPGVSPIARVLQRGDRHRARAQNQRRRHRLHPRAHRRAGDSARVRAARRETQARFELRRAIQPAVWHRLLPHARRLRPCRARRAFVHRRRRWSRSRTKSITKSMRTRASRNSARGK